MTQGIQREETGVAQEELKAMTTAYDALEPLGEEARARAVSWPGGRTRR